MSMLPKNTHRRLFAPGLALESGELLPAEYLNNLAADPEKRRQWLEGSWKQGDLPSGFGPMLMHAGLTRGESSKVRCRQCGSETATQCNGVGCFALEGQDEPLPASVAELLNKIDIKAEAGLCYFTLESAREFLKDIREIVATAQGKEYKL